MVELGDATGSVGGRCRRVDDSVRRITRRGIDYDAASSESLIQ